MAIFAAGAASYPFSKSQVELGSLRVLLRTSGRRLKVQQRPNSVTISEKSSEQLIPSTYKCLTFS